MCFPSTSTSARLSGGAVCLLLSGCSPAFYDAVIPRDAAFEVSCEPHPAGRVPHPSDVHIDITFGGAARRYSFSCDHQAELLIQLRLIQDLWCDGLRVPDKLIGNLQVAASESELTGARGAALDDGEGYVTFNCDAWLPELIDKVNSAGCCP